MDAEARHLPVALQVNRVNRARRLYERLGFREVGRTETHVAMRRDSAGEGYASGQGLDGGDYLAHGEVHGLAEVGAELGVARLDTEETHVAVQLGAEERSEHGRGQRVGGGADAVDLLAVQPANLAHALAHLGGVDEQDEVGREATEGAGMALGRGPGGDDEPVRPERAVVERLGDADAGRVVATQRMADPEERDAGWTVRRLALRQGPSQSRLPGPAGRRRVLHSSE